MTKIHALIERGGPQACVLIGLYEDRDHAIDVATSHAQHRLARCLESDRNIFGQGAADIHYAMTQVDVGSTHQIGLIARPFDEADAMTWIVDTREIILSAPVEQPELEGVTSPSGDPT